MFVLRIWRWLSGYVLFCGSQGFSERFLNLCRNENILLWNTRITDGVMYSNIRARDYKRLRQCAKRSGMRLRVKQRHGLPFLARRYRSRRGMFVGFVFLLAFVYVMSSMLWIVEVQGNNAVKSEKIMQTPSELGVTEGALKSRLNIQEIQRLALSALPELSWVSVNISGCRAVIEVCEQTRAPQIIDTLTPSNIVAGRDGQIIKLEVLEGTASRKIGSAVVKGDLLISGVTQDKDGTPRLHRARGNVIALTSRNVESSAERLLGANALVSEKTRYSLYVFSLIIPFGVKADCTEYYCNTEYVSAGDTVLPIGLIRERFSVRNETGIELSESRAQLLAYEKYFHKQRSELDGAIITESEIICTQSGDRCDVSGKYTCEEKIGEEREILVE